MISKKKIFKVLLSTQLLLKLNTQGISRKNKF